MTSPLCVKCGKPLARQQVNGKFTDSYGCPCMFNESTTDQLTMDHAVQLYSAFLSGRAICMHEGGWDVIRIAQDKILGEGK